MTADRERDKAALKLVKVAKDLCSSGHVFDLLCEAESQLKKDIKYAN